MWAGALADEGLVVEAGFGGGEVLFVLGEVFAEALALGRHVDLALIVKIEDGPRACIQSCVGAIRPIVLIVSLVMTDTRASRRMMSWFSL